MKKSFVFFEIISIVRRGGEKVWRGNCPERNVHLLKYQPGMD
jgi:hypothetical protein